MLAKLKSIVEKAMTNKVESDNGRIKLMQMMANLEDFMATDFNQSQYKLRSDQRILEKYTEVANNDSHWRAFETIDDFVRDQLADCQAFFEVFSDQEKLRQKCLSLKATLDQRSESYAQLE